VQTCTNRRRRAQSRFGRTQQRLIVPPQTRTERDIHVKQVRIGKQRFHHEQARERFADDASGARPSVTPRNDRHEFVANERAERRRSAHVRGNRAVALDARGAGHVAATLGVFDAHEHDRLHIVRRNRAIDIGRHVREILGQAAVGHVDHRYGRARTTCCWRTVHVDATCFVHDARRDRERFVRGRGLVRAGRIDGVHGKRWARRDSRRLNGRGRVRARDTHDAQRECSAFAGHA